MSLSLPAAIARVVLVLAGAIGSNVSLTSPQPRATTSERKPYGSLTLLEIILSSKWLAAVAKTAICFIALQECLIVFSNVLSGTTASFATPTGLSPNVFFIFGTCLSALGGFIRWICYRTLGRHFTFQLSIKRDHALVKDGPYSIVRHPGYTGYFFMFFGTQMWLLSEGSWVRSQLHTLSILGLLCFASFTGIVGCIVVGMMKRLSMEDSALHAHFGKEWETWAATARWKLFPGVY